MTGPRCAQLRQALGVYVLGAIDPAGRAELEAHLAECPACRDELAALAGLPALISRVSEEQLHDAAGGADDVLLDRVLSQVTAQRRRTRRRVLLAAAGAMLAAVLFVAGGTWSLVGGSSDSPAPGGPAPGPQSVEPAPSLFASDPNSRVSAAVGLTPKAWGTAVTAQLSGLPKETHCTLVAIGRQGERDVAASWTVTYRAKAVFYGSTGIHPDELARFEVMTEEGQRLLVIPAGQ